MNDGRITDAGQNRYARNNAMTVGDKLDSKSVPLIARWTVAAAAVIFGLFLAFFGNWWAPYALDLLADSVTGSWLELIVPFLPMAFVGLGALVLTYGRNQRSD